MVKYSEYVQNREVSMIVKEKMRAMSRMAMFESSKEGKQSLATIRFFRTDFIRWEILKTVVSVTVGFAIILGLIILYNLEFLIKNATKLNYRELGFKTLGIYIVILIAYISFTILTSVYRFRWSRKHYLKYEKQMKELARIYDLEEQGQEEKDDTTFSDKG